MSKSMKVQVTSQNRSKITARACLGLVGLAAATVGAAAQGTAPSSGAVPGVTARPPVARQIEPMVAPVRRTAPKQVASPAYVVAPANAHGLQAAATNKAVAAPPVVQVQAPTPAPGPAATSPITTKSTPPPVQALAPSASKTPKIVVHTCRIGQDYSEKLKSCVTPGVTSRAATKVANAAKSARNKLGVSIESVTRSALGAKRKP
jgi:hypothetical protein